VYFIFFRKKKEVEEEVVIPLIPAYEEAIEKLHQLDEKLLWQNNKVKEYYSELTEIVRNYIGRDIEIPQTFDRLQFHETKVSISQILLNLHF